MESTQINSPKIGPNRIILELPLPPKALHPNSRPHWRTKAEAVKRARRDARLVAGPQRPSAPFARATVQATFYVARRNDTDNLAAWLKSYLDGLQDGGIVANDRDLTVLPPFQTIGVPAAQQRVVLEITGEAQA